MKPFTIPKRIRIIFAISPLGIILIYFGIDGLHDLPRPQELTKHSGTIEYYKIEKLYYHDLNRYKSSYVIKIYNVDTLFFTPLFRYGDTLKNYLPKAQKVEIWNYPLPGWKEIEQISINGKMVIKYKYNPILFIIPLIIGLGFIALSIQHIIKHQEDYFG